ncbi:MAG: hypothetical protein V3T72_12650 [Thermoanaerobaculia bacterium]
MEIAWQNGAGDFLGLTACSNGLCLRIASGPRRRLVLADSFLGADAILGLAANVAEPALEGVEAAAVEAPRV